MPSPPGRLRLVVPAVVFALAAAVGCSKQKPTALENADKDGVAPASLIAGGDGSADTVAFTGTHGTTVYAAGESAKIPDDFPKAVPLYPGSKLNAAVTNDRGGKKAFVVMFQTPDSAERVIAYYKSQLKAFKQNADMTMGGMHMLTLAAPDGSLDVALVLSTEGDHTAVQLTALPSPPTAKTP